MQLYWGGYGFPVNACEVTSTTRTEFSAFGRPLRYRVAYDVVAVVDGSGQDDLTSVEIALRTALATPYQDLVLRTDTGRVSSASILNRSSVTGCRVVAGPDFREAQGAEFVTRRTASFTVEAEYLIPGTANAVVNFTETVSIQGNGGPDRFWRFPLNAVPIRQQLTPYSLVRATQSGMAVGHTKRPTRPDPIWPQFVVNPADNKSFDQPESKGQAYLNWPIHWSYTFEVGGLPLVGFPNLPPLK